jgi:hypothetical protein
MANQGVLELTLLGVDSQPTRDPSTLVSFIRTSDGREIGRATQSFPPARRFSVPAFPQERAIACVITPGRYRTREVGIFTFTDGETISRSPTVLRIPQKWQASFVAWADLPKARFGALRTCLEKSKSLRVKDGKSLGQFAEDAYDDVDDGDRVTINAKACLLNLFAKLNTLKEPVFGRKPWFGFVETVLVIGRERLIALVDDEMRTRVKTILDRIDDFDLYKPTPVGDHFKNIPSGFSFARKDMVSVKTREEHGNLQLTLTQAKDIDGKAVTILDADMDENGKLMAHLGDLFKHKFNGGTHPFDIHEYLVLEDQRRALGYELV